MSDKRKKKKTVWQKYTAMAFCLLIVAVCGIIMASYINRGGETETSVAEEIFSLAALFVGMYVAMTVQIIIHEAGHLIFGLLSGYRFSSFRIFSFMWVKENGVIRFRRLNLAGYGRTVPYDSARYERWKNSSCPL